MISTEMVVLPTMFVCITLAIKALADAGTKRKIMDGNVSEELIRAMVLADEKNRQMSALKWGLVLTTLGIACGLVQVLELEAGTPGTLGLVIGAAGLGLLLYHGITRKTN